MSVELRLGGYIHRQPARCESRRRPIVVTDLGPARTTGHDIVERDANGRGTRGRRAPACFRNHRESHL